MLSILLILLSLLVLFVSIVLTTISSFVIYSIPLFIFKIINKKIYNNIKIKQINYESDMLAFGVKYSFTICYYSKNESFIDHMEDRLENRIFSLIEKRKKTPEENTIERETYKCDIYVMYKGLEGLKSSLIDANSSK